MIKFIFGKPSPKNSMDETEPHHDLTEQHKNMSLEDELKPS